MPRIKILSVCTSDTSGGAARAAYRIHQGVRGLGVESRMFVKDKRSADDTVIALSAFVSNNPFYKAFDWVRNKCKNKLQHFRWNRYPQRDRIFMSDLRGTDLHGALQKLDYDVLHLHWLNLRFVDMDDLKNIRKPIVWTLHDSWQFCGVCHYFFDCERYKQQCGCCPILHSDDENDLSHRIWMRKAEVYRNLNIHIVTPSRWLGQCAKQSGLFGRFPVHVIPNCLDAKVFRPLAVNEFSPRWREFQEKRLEKPFVLYGAMNAAMDKIKGFANLLSALKLIEQNGHSDDFELIVFGANASDLSIDVNIPIHYVGYISDTNDLVSLYNLASVMVVPSLTEVFGQTASEALACGTPVVAFNCTGIKEIVEHKVCGYLAEAYEDTDLAKGILWCLANNAENALGKAGREKVLQNYTPEVVSRKYVELYEKVKK